MPTVPMPKPMQEILRERDKACKVGLLIQSVVEADQEEGLKFKDSLEVGRDEKPFKRGKHYYRVWRNKKTGRFAKRPELGERAKQLGLRNYSRKTKAP